jgi:two-component system, LytTR family, response regulator
MKPLRVLVVDDEPLARQRIEDLLAKEDNVQVIGTAGNGAEAMEAIRSLNPDLVFLDVQMPGMSGIEVAERMGDDMPPIIFVTAYDKFAINAFDLAAVDYLLKPFDDERFAQAFARVRKTAKPRQQYADRISVESRGQTRVVPVEDIQYITASGPYAELHVGKNAWAVRERMQALEERLDPDRFIRTHRSVIVRIDLIDALLRRPGGDYAVRLKDGTELSVSRARRDEVERKLGI